MTSQYLWARVAGVDPDLRASDADRERVAERLRQGHAEGRLDMSEFQQRLEDCYEAKTLGQLRELVKDLPRQATHDERGSHVSFRQWRWRLAPLAPLLIALILVSAVVGHPVLWLLIPLVFIIWRTSWYPRRSWVGPRRGPGDWI
jgi:hypothetical protein